LPPVGCGSNAIDAAEFFGCSNFQDVKYDYTVDPIGTGDRSSMTLKVIEKQERYTSTCNDMRSVMLQINEYDDDTEEPASVNITDLT